MKKLIQLTSLLTLAVASFASQAAEDNRQLVKMPEMMQAHMLSNMRDHLVTINQILIAMSAGKLNEAADLAESRLGMSSLDKHGAAHMAKVMPEQMRRTGTGMHRAASQFALKAQEGDTAGAYRALTKVTTSCVACHSAYRIR